MAKYTDNEISAAVSQFIKSSVTVKKDALGPVDVSAKYEETLQLFSSTLILDPNSIFYLICLASNKLNAEVLRAIDLVTDIDIAITEMAKRTTNITQTTQLGNAASALLTANSILNKDAAVSAAPLDKYNQALKNFTDASLAPNVKNGSTIVRPPQAAQAAARADLASLAPMYIDILSWAVRLMTIIPLAGGGQFKSLNLQVIALQESLIQARANLISLQKAFEDPNTTQDQKIALCKDAFLQITAGQAVIKNLSVVADPLLPRMSSNDGLLLGYPAMPGPSGIFTPATVLGTRSAPWVITPGTQDQLVIAEDGNAPTTYTITVPPQPFVESIGTATSYDLHGWSTAYVVGTGSAPFVITDVPGGLFEVYVDGTRYFGHINASTYDMPTMLGVLQNLLNAHGDALSTVLSVDDGGGTGYVHFVHQSPGFHTILVGEFDPATQPYTGPLGLTNNPSSTGVDANNLVEIDGNPSTVLSSGSASDIATAINSWASVASLPYHATAIGTKISIANTAPGAQKITLTAPLASIDPVGRATILRTYTTLGFFEGQSDENGDVTAQKVADYINSIGKLKAAVVRQDFAYDTTGSAIGPQTFQVPVGAVPQSSSTDHAGDMLYILNGTNADYYRIVSITPSGSFDLIVVENTSTLIYPDTGHVGWSVVRETVSLTSTLTKDSLNGLTTKVDVRAASANSILGYTVGFAVGTTSGFKVKKSGVDQDFSASDVEVGDYVQLAGPAVSAVVGTLYLDGSMVGCPGWLALNAITTSDFASCSVSSSTSPLILWEGAHYFALGERLNVWTAGTLRVRANVFVSSGSAQLQVSLYRYSQVGGSITLVSEVLSSVFSNTSWEVVTVEAPYAESTGNTDDFVYMEIKAITSSGSPITVEIATGQSNENPGIYSTMSMALFFRQ
jgi:hypothetical protein